MDVLRLAPDTYFPDKLIQGYTSMIWTERFLVPGEFQMKTARIDETLELLPQNEVSFLSHRDTAEVMMVEDHLFSKNAEGVWEMTVVGRSVDSILQSRWVEAPYQKRRKMARTYRPTGAALVLIWNAIDNTTGTDATRAGHKTWNTLDALPNVMVSDSVDDGGPTVKRWWLTEGMLYEQLIDILEQDELGIRTIRPRTDVEKKVRIKVNGEQLGEIEREEVLDSGALRFDVFRGTDRSHTQSVVPQVTFNVLNGDLKEPSYLYSHKDWKTGIEVVSEIHVKDIYRAGQELNSGWNRRIMTLDAGSPELPDKPEDPGKNATPEENNQYEADLADWRNERDAIYEEFREDTEREGLRELKKFRKLSIFTGNTTLKAPYVYKEDYDLGDTISIKGDYDEITRMIVQEHIRTEDSEGDRGYPGLVLP